MSLELITAICALIVALLTGYMSYKGESLKFKKTLFSISILAIVVTAISGFEELYRKKKLEEVLSEIDQRWALLKGAKIDSVEFEILISDGFMRLSGISEELEGVEFGISNVKLLGSEVSIDTHLFMSDIFSVYNLPKSSRIGTAVATIVADRFGDEKEIKEFKDVNCVSSNFIKEDFMVVFETKDHTICSITFEFSISSNDLRVSNLLGSSRIYLQVPKTKQTECWGICEKVFLSVRAVLNTGDGLMPDMIEISPSAYLSRPSSEDGGVSVFDMSGKTLEELLEIRFKNTFSFRNRGAFLGTQGVLYEIYKALTTGEFQARVSQLVWTTDESPDYGTLIGAIPPIDREGAEPVRVREWCGFRDTSVCWYLFAVLVPETSSATTQ